MQCLALEILVLVMDGSVVGQGCYALMTSVIYKGHVEGWTGLRTLPLAWRVRQVSKGHFPEDFHINLVELVMSVIPEDTELSLCNTDG